MRFRYPASQRYFRWEHERSPYVIELNLDMVERLLPEIQAAQRSGNEIGGLLTGSFPRAKTLTMRIEDYIAIAPLRNSGGEYDLSPEHRAVLSTARHRLIGQQTSVLGFFRSHEREGKLVLSADDRAFLGVEFRRAIHTALVISGTEPYLAAFFVPDSKGTIQSGPPFSEFLFHADRLLSMAHVAGGPVETTSQEGVASPPERRHAFAHKQWWLWSASAAVALICLLLTAWAPTAVRLLRSGQTLGLSVTKQSEVLELQWNQHQPDLQRASSATLAITDGTFSRQWTLSPLEMRSGSIAYRQHGSQVRFTLSLHLPGSMDLVQSVVWPGSNTRPL